MRTSGYEVNVGLHGETRRGKNAVAAERVLAGQAGGFDKSQPLFNAAWLGTVAIMIEDALAPGEAKVRIFAAGQNGRVFDGYSDRKSTRLNSSHLTQSRM